MCIFESDFPSKEGALTSSTVITEITHAGLEVRGFVSAWLVGHRHDQDESVSLWDEKGFVADVCFYRWS